MKYVQPVGAVEDAPYVDANPAAGIEGSPVPAAAIEHPQREIMEVITQAGLVPDDADLTQLWQALQRAIARIPVDNFVLDGVNDVVDIYDAVAGTFTPPAGARCIEFLLVGGGGGGNAAGDRSNTSGGASGGVLLLRTEHLEDAVYSIVVGAGGVGSSTPIGNAGGATSVTCSTRGILGTTNGGEGGHNGIVHGGAVSANIPPVWAFKGNDTQSSHECASGNLLGWRNFGAAAPLVGAQGFAYLLTSPGHGGTGSNSGHGYSGANGIVFATLY